ncbi:hypothetical protein [Ochrobactrum sp. AN78]|uniref:hypothetical protein n=1 Tax=Ochrobactrum sp. AN78 TaxID=3039853 RepID=UPI002989B5FB|nr:hypothetical protein [Ochrobactrum sp. AN78]MDH7793637.1 hypothetical protein [Ochrobactrum sp. AN78]
MNHPFALIACLLLIGSLGFLILTIVSLLKQRPESAQTPAHAEYRQRDFLQSLVMTYGALLPIYVPELYAHLHLHQQDLARSEDD